jgi:epoxyqueuosine reductase
MAGSNKSALTRRIRAEAQRLGFFKTGVTAARPLPSPERLEQWLSGGMHGKMGYMPRQARRRKDPRRVLENARSLVVLAMNYHSGEQLEEDPVRGRISRYAWGDDYHDVVKERLEELYRFIRREEPAASGLCYVDTGPIMEKVWGAETALGWIGKHTNLIAREQGSWFFVGVILLDLELEYDAPEADHCGTCERCISACPTGAIVAPYVLDARLCISYLTIELRGSIPRALRRSIGNRIYGCDDCQEVCPWNRFAVPSPEPAFHPREGNWMPELEPLVDLTPEEFDRRFHSSPIRRAERDGFVRNVVVALGNSRRAEAVAPLARAFGDAGAVVRSHAAWALGEIDSPAARALLAASRQTESDPAVVEEIETALGARL